MVSSIDAVVDDEVICDKALLDCTKQVKPAVTQALELFMRQTANTRKVPDGLEAKILSRLYSLMGLKEKRNYHWHVVVGAVHP